MGKLVHSKSGVLFPIMSLQKLKSLMKTCTDNTVALIKTSSDLVNEVKLIIFERDIRESRLLQNECNVCPINHKEAIKHKTSGLCKDPLTFKEIVDVSFKSAVKGILFLIICTVQRNHLQACSDKH